MMPLAFDGLSARNVLLFCFTAMQMAEQNPRRTTRLLSFKADLERLCQDIGVSTEEEERDRVADTISRLTYIENREGDIGRGFGCMVYVRRKAYIKAVANPSLFYLITERKMKEFLEDVQKLAGVKDDWAQAMGLSLLYDKHHNNHTHFTLERRRILKRFPPQSLSIRSIEDGRRQWDRAKSLLSERISCSLQEIKADLAKTHKAWYDQRVDVQFED